MSAINRGLKTGDPASLKLAEQRGLNQSDALVAEKRLQSTIDDILESHGVKAKDIRKTFAQLSTLERRLGGRVTLNEPTTPYGLGKLKGINVTKPGTWTESVGAAAKDVAQGKPIWSGKPTDVDVRTAFRRTGDRPDLGAFGYKDLGEGEFVEPPTPPAPRPLGLPSPPPTGLQTTNPAPRPAGSAVQPTENGLGAPAPPPMIQGGTRGALNAPAPAPFAQTPPVNAATASMQVEPTNLEAAKARANQLAGQVTGRGFVVKDGVATPVPRGELPGKAPKPKKGPAPKKVAENPTKPLDFEQPAPETKTPAQQSDAWAQGERPPAPKVDAAT